MFKMLALLGLILVLWMGFERPPAAEAAPSPSLHIPQSDFPDTVQVQYYDISGDTAEAMRHAINQNRPYPRDSHTDWRIGWSWPGYGRADCRLDQARLKTRISVSLPRWQSAGMPEPALQAQWQRFSQRLAEREAQQVQVVMAGLERMQKTLRYSTCQNVEQRLIAITTDMRQQGAALDRPAGHGTRLASR